MTIELERARAIAWEHWPSSHDFPEREAAERAALVALTEAADEIASLRARVEAVEQLLEGRDAFIVRWGLWDDFVDSTRHVLKDTP